MSAQPFSTGRRLHHKAKAAFSLVELLVVVGIIALLGAATMPAFTDMLRAGRLSAGSRLLIDELGYARQTALSKNIPVEVRLYKLPSYNNASGPAEVWRAFQVFEITSAGERATGNAMFLSTPVIISPDTAHSSILKLNEMTPSQDVGGIDKNRVRYVAFRFSPNGGTNLTSDNNHMTLIIQQGKPLTEGANFATVQVNHITGTVRVYRP